MAPTLRALFFDVFGTCVDWRTSVTEALQTAAHEALSNPGTGIDSDVEAKAKGMTTAEWGEFAQEWRNTYLEFTRALARDSSIKWKSVDQHHLDSLYELLETHGLLVSASGSDSGCKAAKGSLLTDTQIQNLSLIWHRLKPWPDTCQGIIELNTRFQTSTLTNGNLALIREMVDNAHMEFTHVFSAEMFNSYKPNPAVYLGAAEKLGVKPTECALVAAHLDDLEAAQKCGFQTVYIERPLEERFLDMRKREGLVDVWVKEDEDGFVTAARRLGISSSS